MIHSALSIFKNIRIDDRRITLLMTESNYVHLWFPSTVLDTFLVADYTRATFQVSEVGILTCSILTNSLSTQAYDKLCDYGANH